MPRYTLSVCVCVCVCVCVFPVVFDRSHCPNILSCVFGLALACFQGSWPTVDHSGWSVGPGMAAHRDDDDLLFPGIELCTYERHFRILSAGLGLQALGITLHSLRH